MFSYWFNIHVNIIAGSGVMTIFFYKRLTRNYWMLQNARATAFTFSELFRVKDFFSKEILAENFIFCAVSYFHRVLFCSNIQVCNNFAWTKTFPSYRNHSIDLYCKLSYWFLYINIWLYHWTWVMSPINQFDPRLFPVIVQSCF